MLIFIQVEIAGFLPFLLTQHVPLLSAIYHQCPELSPC